MTVKAVPHITRTARGAKNIKTATDALKHCSNQSIIADELSSLDTGVNKADLYPHTGYLLHYIR